MPSKSAAARVLLALVPLAPGCTTFEISITPAAMELPPPGVEQPALTIEVESTYAPFRDGRLDRSDLYPRDGRLGRSESWRYESSFRETRRFDVVRRGDAGQGLHCRLAIVSGREPPNDLLRALSALTIGLVPHRQRERIEVQATVSAPGRESSTYAMSADVVCKSVGVADTRLYRGWSQEPERRVVAALVARMARDGWLDPAAVRR